MSLLSRQGCSSSITDLKRKGDENGKLMVQPLYRCEVCPKSFNKKQAFKNHQFMHKKKVWKKIKPSSKEKLLGNSSCSAKINLPKAINCEVTSHENADKKELLSTSNSIVQENDREVKVPNKIPPDTHQQSNVVKSNSKSKSKTTNLTATSINSLLHSSNSPAPSASYTCPFCDKVFANRKTYINHKKNHRKKIKSALKITESNCEQVIVDFIRSIRLATEATKSSADQGASTLKCDNSSFDLRTVINNASLNSKKDCISPVHAIPSKNQTPKNCDIKAFDQLKHFNSSKRLNSTPFFKFNKQKCAKRIPLNQNIVPYEC